MGRYDDDLFKKLNKEKPLIKQMQQKGGVTVKKMDLPGRTPKAPEPEIFNARPETPPSTGDRRAFREYDATPAQRGGEKPRERDIAPFGTGVRPAGKPPARETTVRTRLAPQKGPGLFAQPEKSPAQPVPGAPARRPESAARPARRESPVYAQSRAQPAVTGARYDLRQAPAEKQRRYRHELKYYVNRRDYEMLRSAFSSLMAPDVNAKDGGYHIRSLYFDDYQDSALRDKIHGVKSRKKYRIRIYNKSASLIRLERKFKDGEFVSKESMPLTREEYDGIVQGDIGFLLQKDNSLAHGLYAEMRTKGLRPVVVVDYYREAFVYGVEDVRVTLDSDLRSGLFTKELFGREILTLPVYEQGLVVLEVKYNAFLPRFIKAVLNNAEYSSRSAVSKYLLCRKYD